MGKNTHNCPIEIKDALFSLGKTTAVFAFVLKDSDRGKTPCWLEDIVWRLGNKTNGPFLSCSCDRQDTSSCRQ